MSQLVMAEEAVMQARKEGRWADASEELERWLALSRQMAAEGVASDRSSSSTPVKGGMRLRFARSKSSGSMEPAAEESSGSARTHSAAALVKERVPRVSKLLDRHTGCETVAYLTLVNKQNEHGKVQARLLAMTSAALYNLSLDGGKLKRRIPLEAIASVTLDESSGSFVLHVPREYDYLITAMHNGVAVRTDGSAFDYELKGADIIAAAGTPAYFAAHVIDALQTVYVAIQDGVQQLPVRTFRGSGGQGLAQVVQRKGHSLDTFGAADDDDDDDDDQDGGGDGDRVVEDDTPVDSQRGRLVSAYC